MLNIEDIEVLTLGAFVKQQRKQRRDDFSSGHIVSANKALDGGLLVIGVCKAVALLKDGMITLLSDATILANENTKILASDDVVEIFMGTPSSTAVCATESPQIESVLSLGPEGVFLLATDPKRPYSKEKETVKLSSNAYESELYVNAIAFSYNTGLEGDVVFRVDAPARREPQSL